MATRLYFTSAGTPAASPAFGSIWGITAAAVRRPLVTTPSGTTNTQLTTSESVASAPLNILTWQGISDEVLPAGDVAGNFDLVICGIEGVASTDGWLQARVSVVSLDGATEYGVLYAGQIQVAPSAVATDPHYEFNTASRTRTLTGVPLDTVTVPAEGGRLVVELGWRTSNTSTSARSVGLRVGDATTVTDYTLTVDQTSTTGRPWIEFSQTLFPPPAAGLTLDATHPAWTPGAAFTLQPAQQLQLDAAHPPWTPAAAFSLVTVVPVDLALTATHPAWTPGAAFTLDTQITLDTDPDAYDGVVFDGTGTVDYSPPVTPPPTPPGGAAGYGAPLTPVRVDIATAWGPVTIIDGTRPVRATTRASRPARRTRITVAGVDVTYWRGIRTPDPAYTRIEPLEYSGAVLVFPQFNACYEDIDDPTGTDHTWLHEDAYVTVEKVDPATNTVIATQFEGWIGALDVSGPTLTVQCGGLLTGPAATEFKPFPLWRSRRDGGKVAYDAVTQVARQPFIPFLGPDTGIPITNAGGMYYLEWLQQLCSMLVDRTGPWTIMLNPTRRGVWELRRKDVSTIHGTLYFDKTRIVPSLRRDFTAEPNGVFATATTPDGQRIRFLSTPGLRKGPAAPYPMAGGASFGPGTTNEATVNGDGITLMLNRLIITGYLTRPDSVGGYDADVTRAIRALQKDAGLPRTGTMTTATWNALYDLGVTGYSLTYSGITRAAETDQVRPNNRSANGSIMGPNPAFDSAVKRRDIDIHMGPGLQRDQVKEWAELELDPGTPNWVGTVDLHTAIIAGEHQPGDPLSPEQILPADEVRPGWNLWAPLWNGGTLFHVASVDVPAERSGKGGGPVRVALDTRARDQLKVWEIVRRNREARKSPARIWLDQRSSTMPKDFGEWDDLGGIIDRQDLAGGAWTTFDVLAGQAGTIMRVRFKVSPPREYVVVVFGRHVEAEGLERRFGQPLTQAGTERWEAPDVQDWLEDRVWLATWGGADQPCGYWPRKKTNENGPTGHPLTGEFRDEASVGYHTFAEPVLTVGVWVAGGDADLVGGRIMWNQLEGGA